MGTTPESVSGDYERSGRIGGLLALGRLSVQLSRIERSITYPDGRQESDAEHSFMLVLLASSYAAEFLPELNSDRVARKAAVHELLETYTGDIVTLGATARALEEKEQLERQALEQFKVDYATWPQLMFDLEEYEAHATPEDRFVRVFDKVMPKIIHILNGGTDIRHAGITSIADYDYAMSSVSEKLRRVAPDQADAMDILAECTEVIRREVFSQPT